MNILLLYGNTPPSFDGGAYYLLELSCALAADHNVAVPVLNDVDPHFLEQAQKAGVNVVKMGKSWRFGSMWSTFLKLIKVHQKYKIDKVILIYPPARRSKINRYLIPLVLPFSRRFRGYDLVMFKPFPVWPRISELLAAVSATLFAKTIISHEQQYVDLYRKIPIFGRRVYWSPLGSTIDYHTDKRRSDLSRWGLSKNDFVIGFMGFWYKSKGVHLLIQAFEGLKNREKYRSAKLLLVGGRSKNDMINNYEIMIMDQIDRSAHKADIIHTGFIQERDVGALLKRVDCYVLPYVSQFTSRSSITPAVKLGLPAIISSPNSQASGFVKHKVEALIVSPGSVSDLMDSIDTIHSNESLGKTLGNNIGLLEPLYSWDSLIKTFIRSGNDFY